ncbi:MAG: methenyltetrahydrofolate cyclohydrolase [Chloroflexota bacterium]
MPDMQTVQGFLDTLASDSPAPGGGSAAAISGAMSAALVSMVCRLTIGKKKYAAVESEAKTILERSEELRSELSQLVVEDTKAFEAVMAAYRLPKESDSDKETRNAAIQTALKQATQTPLATAKSCAEVIALSDSIARIGNTNALSDAGVASLTALAGLKGAALNVLINLNSIQDVDFISQIWEEVDTLIKEYTNLADQVYEFVQSKVSETN